MIHQRSAVAVMVVPYVPQTFRLALQGVPEHIDIDEPVDVVYHLAALASPKPTCTT